MLSKIAGSSPKSKAECIGECPHVRYPSRNLLQKGFTTSATFAKSEFFICGNGPYILVSEFDLLEFDFGRIRMPFSYTEVAVFPLLQISVRGIIPMPQEKFILAFGANYLAIIGLDQLKDGGQLCQSRVVSARGIIVGGRRLGANKVQVFYENGCYETLEIVEKRRKHISIVQKGVKKLDLKGVKIMITKWEDIPTLYEKYPVAPNILKKICLWKGDITKLQIDAIVNAANSELSEGGGVNRAIHRAAGEKELQRECAQFDGCEVGEAVTTSGCGIQHIKKIIHTVGPRVKSGREPNDDQYIQLRSCYRQSLKQLIDNGLRTIAFCCISTGIYGYPSDEAAYLVGNCLNKFLRKNGDSVDRIVICVFQKEDEEKYNVFFDEYERHVVMKTAEKEETAKRKVEEAADPSEREDKKKKEEPAEDDDIVCLD